MPAIVDIIVCAGDVIKVHVIYTCNVEYLGKPIARTEDTFIRKLTPTSYSNYKGVGNATSALLLSSIRTVCARIRRMSPPVLLCISQTRFDPRALRFNLTRLTSD